MKRSVMTPEQMSAIYEMGKKVYYGTINEQDASKRIKQDYGINQTSLIYYFRSLRKMLDGSPTYSIGIGSALRDFLLSHIYNEFGKERLLGALKQFLACIEYYENSHNNVVQKRNRAIYKKYNDILKM